MRFRSPIATLQQKPGLKRIIAFALMFVMGITTFAAYPTLLDNLAYGASLGLSDFDVAVRFAPEDETDNVKLDGIQVGLDIEDYQDISSRPTDEDGFTSFNLYETGELLANAKATISWSGVPDGYTVLYEGRTVDGSLSLRAKDLPGKVLELTLQRRISLMAAIDVNFGVNVTQDEAGLEGVAVALKNSDGAALSPAVAESTDEQGAASLTGVASLTDTPLRLYVTLPEGLSPKTTGKTWLSGSASGEFYRTVETDEVTGGNVIDVDVVEGSLQIDGDPVTYSLTIYTDKIQTPTRLSLQAYRFDIDGNGEIRLLEPVGEPIPTSDRGTQNATYQWNLVRNENLVYKVLVEAPQDDLYLAASSWDLSHTSLYDAEKAGNRVTYTFALNPNKVYSNAITSTLTFLPTKTDLRVEKQFVDGIERTDVWVGIVEYTETISPDNITWVHLKNDSDVTKAYAVFQDVILRNAPSRDDDYLFPNATPKTYVIYEYAPIWMEPKPLGEWRISQYAYFPASEMPAGHDSSQYVVWERTKALSPADTKTFFFQNGEATFNNIDDPLPTEDLEGLLVINAVEANRHEWSAEKTARESGIGDYTDNLTITADKGKPIDIDYQVAFTREPANGQITTTLTVEGLYANLSYDKRINTAGSYATVTFNLYKNGSSTPVDSYTIHHAPLANGTSVSDTLMNLKVPSRQLVDNAFDTENLTEYTFEIYGSYHYTVAGKADTLVIGKKYAYLTLDPKKMTINKLESTADLYIKNFQDLIQVPTGLLPENAYISNVKVNGQTVEPSRIKVLSPTEQNYPGFTISGEMNNFANNGKQQTIVTYTVSYRDDTELIPCHDGYSVTNTAKATTVDTTIDVPDDNTVVIKINPYAYLSVNKTLVVQGQNDTAETGVLFELYERNGNTQGSKVAQATTKAGADFVVFSLPTTAVADQPVTDHSLWTKGVEYNRIYRVEHQKPLTYRVIVRGMNPDYPPVTASFAGTAVDGGDGKWIRIDETNDYYYDITLSGAPIEGGGEKVCGRYHLTVHNKPDTTLTVVKTGANTDYAFYLYQQKTGGAAVLVDGQSFTANGVGKTFVGLPVDYTYTLYEVTGPHFRPYPVADWQTVTSADGQPTEIATAINEGKAVYKRSITLVNGQTVTASAENYEAQHLIIRKTTPGGTHPSMKTFQFQVLDSNGAPLFFVKTSGVYVYSAPNAQGATSTLELSVTNGASAELRVTGLPQGAYTVKELEPAKVGGIQVYNWDQGTKNVTLDWSPWDGTRKPTTNETVSFENTLSGSGSMTVQKLLAAGSAYVDVKDSVFTFSVKYTAGNAAVALNSNGLFTITGAVSVNGPAGTFTLRPGQTATISNIPLGAQIYIVETANANFTVATSPAHASESNRTADLLFENDTAKAVVFTNTRKDAAMTLSKTVSGIVADIDDDEVFLLTVSGRFADDLTQDATKVFAFVKNEAAKVNTAIPAGATVGIWGQDTLPVPGVVFGYSYTITETHGSGNEALGNYVVTATGATGSNPFTVKAGATNPVVVNNKRSDLSIKVSKTVTNGAKWPADGFGFALYKQVGTSWVAVNGANGQVVQSITQNPGSYTWTGLAKGLNYRLYEKVSGSFAPDGWTLCTSDADKARGDYYRDIPRTAYSGTAAYEVEVNNSVDTFSIELNKTVAGGDAIWPTDGFTFELRYSADGTTWESYAKISAANGQRIVKKGETAAWSGLFQGYQYRVYEVGMTGYIPEGWSKDATGYYLPVDPSAAGFTGKIAVTNAITDLTVTKAVAPADNAGAASAKFNFSVAVAGVSGNAKFKALGNGSYLYDPAGTVTSIPIAHGDELHLYGLPVGKLITVTEANPGAAYTVTYPDGQTVTLGADAMSGQVKILNTVKTSKITLNKSIKMPDSLAEQWPAGGFTFTLYSRVKGTSTWSLVPNSQRVVTAQSKTAVWNDLAANLEYKVVETGHADYNAVIENGWILEANGDVSRIVTNMSTDVTLTLANQLRFTNIALTKSIAPVSLPSEGIDNELVWSHSDFTYVLYSRASDTAEWAPVANDATKTIGEDDASKTVTWTMLQESIQYRIYEVNPTGYRADNTWTAGTLPGTQTPAFYKDVTPQDGKTVTVNLTNTPTQLNVTKSLFDSGDSAQTFRFQIQDKAGNPLAVTARTNRNAKLRYYVYEPGERNPGLTYVTDIPIVSGQTVTIYGLPEGMPLTLVETERGGYTPVVTIDGASTATLTFGAERGTVNAAIYNDVQDTLLTITKRVEGENDNITAAGKVFTVVVRQRDANGDPGDYLTFDASKRYTGVSATLTDAAKLTLRKDETISVTGIPYLGENRYLVEEPASLLPAGFMLDTAKGIVFTDFALAGNATDGYRFEASAVVNNLAVPPELGTLTVVKTGANTDYEFYLYRHKVGEETVLVGGQAFTADGDGKTFVGLPVDRSYTLYEVTASNFRPHPLADWQAVTSATGLPTEIAAAIDAGKTVYKRAITLTDNRPVTETVENYEAQHLVIQKSTPSGTHPSMNTFQFQVFAGSGRTALSFVKTGGVYVYSAPDAQGATSTLELTVTNGASAELRVTGLPQGDYTVKELEPAKVGGVQVYSWDNEPKSATLNWSPWDGTRKPTTNETVSFVNTLSGSGSMTVRKALAAGSAYLNEDGVFTFSVKYTANDDAVVLNSNGQFTITGAVSVDAANGTFTLRPDQTATISNIPLGAQIYVEEASHANFTVTASPKHASETDRTADLLFADNTAKDVVFTNARKPAAMTLAKTVSGIVADIDDDEVFLLTVKGRFADDLTQDTAKVFAFVKNEAAKANTAIPAGATVGIWGKDTLPVPGVVYDRTYTVTETHGSGPEALGNYVVTVNGDGSNPFTIVKAGTTNPVVFNNQRSDLSIKVSKTVTAGAKWPDGGFGFALYKQVGTSWVAVNGANGQVVQSITQNPGSYTWTGLAKGLNYRLYETNSGSFAPDGWTPCTSDADKARGDYYRDIPRTAYSETAAYEVEVNNSVDTFSIELNKTVAGGDAIWPTDGFTFELRYSADGTTWKSYTDISAANELRTVKKGETAAWSGLFQGYQYRVYEVGMTGYIPEGWSQDATGYYLPVDPGAAGFTGKIAVTNAVTDLTVTKAVAPAGNAGAASAEFNFSVAVAGVSGNAKFKALGNGSYLYDPDGTVTSISIAHGDELHLYGLPVGKRVTVTEANPGAAYTVTYPDGQTVTLGADAMSGQVDILNTVKTFNITLNKNILMPDDLAEQWPADGFTFTLYSRVKGTSTWSLVPDSQRIVSEQAKTAVWNDLAANLEYKVVEAGHADYNAVLENGWALEASGEAYQQVTFAGSNIALTLQNQLRFTNIALTKSIAPVSLPGEGSSNERVWPFSSFSYVLYSRANDTAEWAPVANDATKTISEDDVSKTVTWTMLQESIQYRIYEVNPIGYRADTSWTAGTLPGTQTPAFYKDVTPQDGETVMVNLTNTPTQLNVTKSLIGLGDDALTFRFQIQDSAGAPLALAARTNRSAKLLYYVYEPGGQNPDLTYVTDIPIVSGQTVTIYGLPEGVAFTLVETGTGGYDPVVTIDGASTATLTFGDERMTADAAIYNDVQDTQLTITKRVEGENENITAAGKVFTAVVRQRDANGDPGDYLTFDASNHYTGVSATLTDAAKLTLRKDETITVTGIPYLGENRYVVEEPDSLLPDGFELDTAKGIAFNDFALTGNAANGYRLVASAVVNNLAIPPEVGGLTVEKTMTGYSGDDVFELAVTGRFYPDTTTETTKTFQFGQTAGNDIHAFGTAVVVQNVVVGETYTVQEVGEADGKLDNYTVTYTIGTAVAASSEDDPARLVVENDRPTNDLVLDKLVLGEFSGEEAFQVSLRSGSRYLTFDASGAFTGLQDSREGTLIAIHNREVITLTGLPVGMEITVEELVDTDAFTPSYIVDGQERDTFTVAILDNDAKHDIRVNNETPTLLTIRKRVQSGGGAEAEGTYYFTITQDGRPVPVTVQEDGTYRFDSESTNTVVAVATGATSETGYVGVGKVTVTGLPYGAYTVQEDIARLPANYALVEQKDNEFRFDTGTGATDAKSTHTVTAVNKGTKEDPTEPTTGTTEPTEPTTGTTEPTEPTEPTTGTTEPTEPTTGTTEPTEPTTGTTTPTDPTTGTSRDRDRDRSSGGTDRQDTDRQSLDYRPIGDSPVPLDDLPVPLTTAIMDDDVPLEGLPQTGRTVAIAIAMISCAALSLGGAAIVGRGRHKEK